MIIKLIIFLGLFAAGYLVGQRARGAGERSANPGLSEQYQATKERYDLLTDNIAASIVVRDAGNKIVFVSPFTEVLTGYSQNEIYSSQSDFFISIAHEDDKQNIERALKVASCGEAFQYRFRYYHKTGILMWAETRTVPVLNNSGEVEASLSITLDVTGSVLYQKQVEEKNRDLQDFTYMISHDLKSPIYTIKGMHGVLCEELERAGVSKEIKEPLEHIKLAALRLEKLVASVLEYSKLSAREFPLESIDTTAALKEIVSEFEPKFKANNTELIIADSFPAVLSNKDAFYQIVSNLLDNAVKYRAESRPLKIEIYPKELKNSRLLELHIKDNGSGIPKDKIESVFRPFQRAHNTIEGSGIGLASIRKLLDKTGGQVRLESAEDQGSTFILIMRRA